MAFEGLADKLEGAFKKLKSKGSLTESDVKEAMREVRLALLEADVSYKVAKDFTKTVTERAIGPVHFAHFNLIEVAFHCSCELSVNDMLEVLLHKVSCNLTKPCRTKLLSVTLNVETVDDSGNCRSVC